MTGVQHAWPDAPAQTTSTSTPPDDPMMTYLRQLNDRRLAALAVGNATQIADCEERLIRIELFLCRLKAWRDGHDCWHPDALPWLG